MSNRADGSVRQRTNSIAESVNYLFKRGKDFVAKTPLAYFFPNLFDGIHLRRCRWKEKQFDIVWNLKPCGSVPRSAIANQKKSVIGICTAQPTQKSIHTCSVAVWHNQKIGFACFGFYRSISISVFSNMVTRHMWADSFPTPAIFWLVDSPKASLVLKHQAYVEC